MIPGQLQVRRQLISLYLSKRSYISGSKRFPSSDGHSRRGHAPYIFAGTPDSVTGSSRVLQEEGPSGGSVEGSPGTITDNRVREFNANSPRESMRYRGDSPPRRCHPPRNVQTNTRNCRERRVLLDVSVLDAMRTGTLHGTVPFHRAHGRQPFPSSREPRQQGTRGPNSRDALGSARDMRFPPANPLFA